MDVYEVLVEALQAANNLQVMSLSGRNKDEVRRGLI